MPVIMSETEQKQVICEVSNLIRTTVANTQATLLGKSSGGRERAEISAAKKVLKRVLGRIPTQTEIDLVLN